MAFMTASPSRFRHESRPQLVLSGSGMAAEHLLEAVEHTGAQRIMLIGSPRSVAEVEKLACALPVVYRHADVAMHVPRETADAARAAAVASSADALLAVGGGSATGVAKAVAHRSGLPIIAVPTTYAGSEATAAWGETEAGRKRVSVDPAVLPAVVIYDATLMLSLSRSLSIASGLNALAHCIDSMWAPSTDPVARALAIEGIRALRDGLAAIARDTDDLVGREHALVGAWLAGQAFASAGSGLHHKLCHLLGGTFDLPHAETHAAVLPHVLALNAPAAPEAESRIAVALGADRAVAGLAELYDLLDAPRSLRDLGLRATDLDDAARAATAIVPPDNPARIDLDGMRPLLDAAWRGALPR
ncbi:MAG TPA: maleylacetate reductase [Baekduia sp.]|nr:maleylacetate reductase [Baekduia sp.]